MPELYSQHASEPNDDDYNHRPSPTFAHNDRHTPMTHPNFNERKPEVYYIGKNDHNEPMHDEPLYDQQPYKSSSPPLHSVHPSSHGGPEVYYLKGAEDNNDIHDRRPSPAYVNNNRVSPEPHQRFSPIPLHHSSGHGPEMYYLKTADDHDKPVVDEHDRHSPRINDHYQKPKLNDNLTHDDHNQQKITVYVLTTAEGDNRENLTPPPRAQRTPSPPIRTSKKQQPISYDIVDDDNKYVVPKKQRPFPTALHDVPTNVPYVPLSQSKASESIQRSMNKYRFGGN